MGENGFVRYRGDGTTEAGKRVSSGGLEGCYLAAKELVAAVNTALAVGQPLLVTGEAGTGKTMLAHSIAAEMELGDPLVFAVRSDHQGRDLLYAFDNMQRFYDAQVQDPRARERANYLSLGALGQAIESDVTRLVLIDEIDKAPRDFPNDLLHALDRMELAIPEINLHRASKSRPVVVITSNRESQLPDPFLRRCVFHHIEFPDRAQLQRILAQRLGSLAIEDKLRQRALDRFLELREMEGLQKKPATSELLTWLRVLQRAGVGVEEIEVKLGNVPYLGAMIKTREDMDLLARTR